jgi:hypothetical protein
MGTPDQNQSIGDGISGPLSDQVNHAAVVGQVDSLAITRRLPGAEANAIRPVRQEEYSATPNQLIDLMSLERRIDHSHSAIRRDLRGKPCTIRTIPPPAP